MQLTEQGILHIEEDDISSLYCYRDQDGMGFEASFLFELQLQGLTLTQGSVRAIQFGFEEEEAPSMKNGNVWWPRYSQRFVPLMRSMMASL